MEAARSRGTGVNKDVNRRFRFHNHTKQWLCSGCHKWKIRKAFHGTKPIPRHRCAACIRATAACIRATAAKAHISTRDVSSAYIDLVETFRQWAKARGESFVYAASRAFVVAMGGVWDRDDPITESCKLSNSPTSHPPNSTSSPSSAPPSPRDI